MSRAQRGFTLVEMMVTLLVMGVALAAVLQANGKIAQSSQSFYQRAVAMQDANQVLERIRNTASGGTFPSNVTAAFPHNGAVGGFSALPSETVRVVYTDRNGDGNALTDNPLDVTVTINYLENGRNASTASLRSLVTQR